MTREKQVVEELLQQIREVAEKWVPSLSLETEVIATKYVVVQALANIIVRLEDIELKLYYADFEKPILK